MQQPQAKNGCSLFDSNNGTADEHSAGGSTSSVPGSLLAMKDVDAMIGGKAVLLGKNFAELDGLIEPKTISKTDQEIVRIIGQHLSSIGLQ